MQAYRIIKQPAVQTSVYSSVPPYIPGFFHESFRRAIKQRPPNLGFKTFRESRNNITESLEENSRRLSKNNISVKEQVCLETARSSSKISHFQNAIAQSKSMIACRSQSQKTAIFWKDGNTQKYSANILKTSEGQSYNELCSLIFTIKPQATSMETQNKFIYVPKQNDTFDFIANQSKQEIIELIQAYYSNISKELSEDIAKVFEKLLISLKGNKCSQKIQENGSNEFNQIKESLNITEKLVFQQISKMELHLNSLKEIINEEYNGTEKAGPICGLSHCSIHSRKYNENTSDLYNKVMDLQNDLSQLAAEINKHGERITQFELTCRNQNNAIYSTKPQELQSEIVLQTESMLIKKEEEIRKLKMQLNYSMEEIMNSRKIISIKQNNLEYSQKFDQMCTLVKIFIILNDNLKKAHEDKDEENIEKLQQEYEEQKDLLNHLCSSPEKNNSPSLSAKKKEKAEQCEKHSQEILTYQNNLLENMEIIKKQENEIQKLNEALVKYQSDEPVNYYSIKPVKSNKLKEIINDAVLKIETYSEDILSSYNVNMQSLDERILHISDRVSNIRNALRNRIEKLVSSNSYQEGKIQRQKEDYESLRDEFLAVKRESKKLKDQLDQQNEILSQAKRSHEKETKNLKSTKKYFKEIIDVLKNKISKSNELITNILRKKTKQMKRIKKNLLLPSMH